MLTIRTLENIKRGASITFYNGIYAILFGIFYLVFFRFILKENFRAITIVWQVFAKYNPALNSLLVRLMVLKGLFIITIGIAIIYLSLYILRKKDRATWIILFIIGLTFWPILLTFEILDKNLYTTVLSSIGWITFIIGMIIPIRYYMQRNYTEY